jgi:hypothetical protein
MVIIRSATLHSMRKPTTKEVIFCNTNVSCTGWIAERKTKAPWERLAVEESSIASMGIGVGGRLHRVEAIGIGGAWVEARARRLLQWGRGTVECEQRRIFRWRRIYRGQAAPQQPGAGTGRRCEHPAAACAGNQRRRGRGKRSGREGPGREVAGEDLRSVMAVPIKDGAGARTHLALGEEETGLRWLGALGSGRFFRAANFSIFRFAEPLRSLNQTSTKVE